jgi:hypothetical protein
VTIFGSGYVGFVRGPPRAGLTAVTAARADLGSQVRRGHEAVGLHDMPACLPGDALVKVDRAAMAVFPRDPDSVFRLKLGCVDPCASGRRNCSTNRDYEVRASLISPPIREKWHVHV